MKWTKKSRVAQYGGADWKNEVKRVSGVSPQQAREIGDSIPEVNFFFYCRQGMYLPSKGMFNKGDAVFFSGEPWYGSAPQCDAYEKIKVKPKKELRPLSSSRNDLTTDSVLQADTEVLSVSSALSSGELMTAIGQALSNAAHNATSNQQQINILGNRS